MDKNQLKALENRLWEAADQLRANSKIGAHDYTAPMLGLIFLRFATLKYHHYQAEIEAEYNSAKGSRTNGRWWTSPWRNAATTCPQRPTTTTC